MPSRVVSTRTFGPGFSIDRVPHFYPTMDGLTVLVDLVSIIRTKFGD